MKIALIVPNYNDIYGAYRHLYKKGFVNPPLSLCYLAAALLEVGHEAIIIDGEAEGLSLKDILARVRDYQPGLAALTATSIDVDRSEVIAKAIKSNFPDLITILGGTHVNIFGEEVLRDTPSLDLCLVGDGEDAIVELADALEKGGPDDLASIDGLIWRQGAEIMQNSFRKIEMRIDRYPLPARHLLNNELYYRSVPYRGYQTTAAVMSSRGCPYSCVYCAVKNIHGGTKVRMRSAESVLEELQVLVRDMKIPHVAFNDDCLTLGRERMLAICEGIKQRGLKFTWEGLSRADLVDEELLKIMNNAGFVRISVGIESGDPEILKVIQKGESLDQITHAIRIAREAGISTRGSVILGNPYETRASVETTLRYIRQNKWLDQAVINVLQPYPGTKVREMILNGEGGSRMIEDHFSKLQRFGSSQVAVNDLNPDELVKLQKIGFARFYLQPRVLWRNLRLSGFKTFMQDGIGFLRSLLGK